MTKGEMLEKISNYYTEQMGRDYGVYAYAGALSVFITEKDLETIIRLNEIK